MFAPFSKMDNIWIEVPAILSDGPEIELLTGSRNIYLKKKTMPAILPVTCAENGIKETLNLLKESP